MHFSLIDPLILIIMAWCIFSSYRQGFVKEVFGLGSVIVGLLLASWFYERTAPAFKDVVKTENLALFFGFSVIFLGTLLVGLLVTWLITKFVKFAKIEWFDRCLGAAFGLQTERVRNSGLAPYFLPGSRVMAVLTPYDLRARFLVGYRSIEKWWREQK